MTRLTDREKQVIKLVAEGRSNKDVAELLDISVKTAMSHREHIMQKLGLHSRTELIRFALEAGHHPGRGLEPVRTRAPSTKRVDSTLSAGFPPPPANHARKTIPGLNAGRLLHGS